MSKKRAARRQAPASIAGIWLGSVLSLGLLYLAGSAVYADLASFRSCSSNDSGLFISSCGKQSLNAGDLILFILLIAAASLTVSLFTIAWRTSQGARK